MSKHLMERIWVEERHLFMVTTCDFQQIGSSCAVEFRDIAA